jgi:hypothetical protein
MVTIFRQSIGEHMGRKESAEQYAATIVMLVAYANYASEQERTQVKHLAYAKSTVAAMFIYGALAASMTYVMFSKDMPVLGWVGVVLSVFCFWVLYSNSIITGSYRNTRNMWIETRKEAEGRLFEFAIGAFDD